MHPFVSFFYGPDKTPFQMDDQIMAFSGFPVPFHGIISRGLRKKFEKERIDSKIWYNYAHLIGTDPARDHVPDLSKLLGYARDCEVLSFSNSAFCVKSYIGKFIKKAYDEAPSFCELWNIKEGHTSSVWKVTILDDNLHVRDHFILNVARDHAAGIELMQTSEKMQAISDKFPEINMSKVYDIDTVKLNYFDKIIQVTVSRNEWIKDAYEIHSLPRKDNNHEHYVLVERFLTSENNPSHITSIQGRRFNKNECDRIEASLEIFRKKTSTTFDVQLNINQGDLVWNGNEVVIIAIS